jgi:hypothetical protein
MGTITIKSASDYSKQLSKLNEINLPHLKEAIQLGDFKEVQRLGKIITARAKALEMWSYGVADVNVTI